MTKISKFLLFVFCLICLFCYIGSVSALDITPYWLPSYINNNEFTKTVNSSSNTFQTQINFLSNSQNIYNNNKYIYLSINAMNNNNYVESTSGSSINLTATCNGGNWASNTSTQYIITYADGSTARVSGTEYDLYCSGYTSNGTISTTTLTDNVDNNPTLEVYLVRNNAPYYTQDLCLYESGYFKCEVQNLSYSHILIKGFTSGKNTSYKVMLSNWAYTTNESVVNSINNQTTTINNSITDVNDSINNSDITGNNSSDSISGITSSFQSSNDWLLNIFTLPYTFITAIINGVSDSCTPISLGTIFDYDLVMPCMNLNSILGNVWTTIVDVICAGVFAFAFRKRIHDFIFAIITLDRKAIKIGGVDIL